ncbi:E3 ubiquitin-protein ligase RNF13 isoform X2 [Halictus rubicundus]|uniref:E3 ubiquitin-protein ligase RNF13 isoform X2 n=1 Tax=Halictus rubicundus TaxID=77578 RepID=UPI0040350AC3
MRQCCLNHQLQLWFMFLIFCVMCNRADILAFSAVARHHIEEEFSDMPARFGGLIPAEGIKGMVVYSDPPTACHEIQGPPNTTNYNSNWIALIARYNCSFEIKVRMAQKAGYDAAIIHNINSNELEPMSAKDSTGIRIPSVFVSEITGLIIKENYLYDQLYFVLINEGTPFNITHLLLPFAIVVGICFLVVVISLIVRCIKDRRRQRRHRMPNSSLKKIPTHKYTKGDPYETCAICLDDYIEGEKLRVLPCAHAYHTKCIDPWLTNNRRVCPVCKRKVFAANEQVDVSDESDSNADDTTPLIRDGHQGTQGGTFTRSYMRYLRDNAFPPAPETLRQDTIHSGSSSDSDQFSEESEDGASASAGEPSSRIAFVSSDVHSINDP